jgi:hypothetical protein
MSTTRKLSLKDDAGLAIGATGAVFAADQAIKSMDSEDDQLDHILKAGVGAAVAIGAYELLRRAELHSKSTSGDHSIHNDRGRRHSSSRSSSHSSNPPHHKRHMFEEMLGAYNLGKELMGDNRHHFAHLVGEAIGATGFVQEMREREREHKETRHK